MLNLYRSKMCGLRGYELWGMGSEGISHRALGSGWMVEGVII